MPKRAALARSAGSYHVRINLTLRTLTADPSGGRPAASVSKTDIGRSAVSNRASRG